MGYYTDFDLGFNCSPEKEQEIKKWCDENEKDGYNIYGFYLGSQDSCKWYSHQEHMKILSENFPLILFRLEGVGEEKGDWWVEYYLGGKIQECQAKIVFDEFDVNKLK